MPKKIYIPPEKRKKYQRADSRFARRITLPDGSKTDVYGDTFKEMQENINAILDEAKSGVIVGDKSTLNQWADKWFKTYKASVRYNTMQMYISMFDKHISPYLGNYILKEIRPVDIQDIMNKAGSWKLKNKKGETVKSGDSSESLLKKVYITISQLLQTAYENHLIASNPCIGIKVKKVEKNDKVKTLSADQQQQILKSSEQTRAYLFVALGLYCGLRREESLGLRWTDIDWQNQRLKILRTVEFGTNQSKVLPLTKSDAGKREIPIPPPLFILLEAANPNHIEMGSTKVKYKVKDGWNIRETKSIYICPSSEGEVMTKSSSKRMWEVVTKRVDFKVTTHMLRHTYCTMLHKAGIDLRTAQYLMGDSDLKTVAKVYTHIENDQINSADAKIKSLYPEYYAAEA